MDYLLVLENLFVFALVIIHVAIIVLLILLLLVPQICGHVLVVPRYQPIFQLSHKFLVLPLLKLLKVLVVFLVQWATHTGRCRPDHLCLRRAHREYRTVLKLDALPRCPVLVGEVHDGAIFQQLMFALHPHAWLAP